MVGVSLRGVNFFAVFPARDETKIATDIVVAVFVLTGGWRCFERSVVLFVGWLAVPSFYVVNYVHCSLPCFPAPEASNYPFLGNRQEVGARVVVMYNLL